jgi:Asp-tRNA(Asn)/Glu-tRNA(Gln) amidotransferase B subunit
MTKITESSIEEFAIELLEKSGYQYIYGPDIAPDRDVQVSRVQDAQERPPDRKTRRKVADGKIENLVISILEHTEIPQLLENFKISKQRKKQCAKNAHWLPQQYVQILHILTGELEIGKLQATQLFPFWKQFKTSIYRNFA